MSEDSREQTGKDSLAETDGVTNSAAAAAGAPGETGSDSKEKASAPGATEPRDIEPRGIEPQQAARAAAPEPPGAAPAERANSTPIAWLALALALIVAAGGMYFMLDLQRREALLMQRVQGLESVSAQDDTGFEQMRANLRRQIELELEGIAARQTRAEEDQQRAADRVQSLVDTATTNTQRELAAQIAALEASVREQQARQQARLTEQEARITEQQRRLTEQQARSAEQQRRLGELSAEDQRAWQLAETRYLLRLANQRLIMAGDTQSAEALLRSADNTLRELDDTDLHALRAAVATDLAAVRAIPQLDIQGLYLRVEALMREADALVLFELPERAVATEPPRAEDWQARLAQGYAAAVAKLSEYIVVSRRDVPIEALMDPQYEGLVRQNLRMLLEQAQAAMLSGNAVLYRKSLERAEGWVTQFFKEDERSAQAMAEELRRLRDERVAVSRPDLGASLAALDAVMRTRLERGANE